jgi:hypothetical protein
MKSGIYFKTLADARYDPAEREVKYRRFMQAALQIEQQLRPPGQSGIPGVGLPPPTSYRWDWWTESPELTAQETRQEVGHLETSSR